MKKFSIFVVVFILFWVVVPETSSAQLSCFEEIEGRTFCISTASDANAIKNGTPTVTQLLSIPVMQFTFEWGYNIAQNATLGFNPDFFATEATARQIASWLGGEYIPETFYVGGPYTIPIGARVKVCGNKYLYAGLVARSMERNKKTYVLGVANYERNLLHNTAIIGTGNLYVPKDPLTQLKEEVSCSTSQTVSTGGGTTPPVTPPTTGSPTTPTTQTTTSVSAYTQNLINIVNNLIEKYRNIRDSNIDSTEIGVNTSPREKTTPRYVSSSVTVNADVLNVRQAPNTQADILGKLKAGNNLNVSCYITGENVEGSLKWWRTSDNRYIWAGGTTNNYQVAYCSN